MIKRGMGVWSPRDILFRLKRLAPSIAFEVSHERDENFVWDGNGPDPQDEGYVAYNFDVTASAIVKGETVKGESTLGGSYNLPAEIDPDIHGYLPQMLREAGLALISRLTSLRFAPAEVPIPTILKAEAKLAVEYLDRVLRLRYAAQRRRAQVIQRSAPLSPTDLKTIKKEMDETKAEDARQDAEIKARREAWAKEEAEKKTKAKETS